LYTIMVANDSMIIITLLDDHIALDTRGTEC
jgi:hypothetical protein